MPRPASLNYEMVAQAAKTLKEQGANPTISKVREVLGTGSLAVIGRHLKVWKAGGPSAADAAVTSAPAKAPQQKTLDITPPAKAELAKSETVEVVELKPVAEAPVKQEKSQDRQPRDKGRRLFNKRNNNNNHNNHHNKNRNRHNQHNHHHQNRERLGYEVELEEDPQPRHEEPEFHSIESLEAMDRQALMKLVRRLESILYKEQVRREAADKMSHDAMQYAEVIKEQVAQRINDLRASMQITIDQLKSEVKAANQQAEKDLLFYRQQLEKANKALLQS